MAKKDETFGQALRRLIGARLAKDLQDRPDVIERLKEKGVIKDTGEDPAEALRAAVDALSLRVKRRPSVLGDLGVKALDLLATAAEEHEDEVKAALPGRVPPDTSRDLAVVFTDLERFTDFTVAEGDTTASRVLDHHYSAVDGIVRARGGTVNKRIGDGHLLTFATPQAAVAASVDMVETVAADLAVRAGAHTGSVSTVRGEVVGSVVNLAARVAGAAAGGESLLTGDMCTLTGEVPGVGYGEPRSVSLKGFAEPVVLVPATRT
jgi:class 3 adenylate cyclase